MPATATAILNAAVPGGGAIIYLGAQAFGGSEVRRPGPSTGLPSATGDACCRAMDWLQVREALEKRVFDRACEVLGLEVDLLFFDTTSTYFVTEQADAPVARDEHGNPVPDGAESVCRAITRTPVLSWCFRAR